MCGIAGYIGAGPLASERVDAALALMRNRGPDAQRKASLRVGQMHVELLHSRLSIIDLDPRSHQPFQIGDHWIVFNGEIYNYLEVRKKLVALGAAFRTESDTEVLLQSYIHYGDRFVDELEGMWSFVIVDLARSRIVLSRDRFGEKPLYFARCGGGLYFASETRFIRALSGTALEVNQQHVLRYLVNGFRALHKTGETFFRGIEELPRASIGITADGQTLAVKRYWNPTWSIDEKLTLQDSIERFRELFLESVRIRLRSDVPLAFCLSGGVDSASIASVAAKLCGADVATFTIIDTDPRYNEEDLVRATVSDIGCRSTCINTSRGGFIDRLSALIRYHDAPLMTISYYVHSFLSEAISRQGFRVALAGTGADEMVTGYYDHFPLHLYEIRGEPEYAEAREQWTRHVKPLVRNPYLTDPDLYLKNPAERAHIFLNCEEFLGCLRVEFSEEFAETQYTASLMRNRMLNELFEEIVPVILHEDDLNSMLYSVENRSPFLDSRLCEFCFSVPARHLVRDGFAKYLLRESMAGIVNDRVRLAREKKGFNASLNSLIDFADPRVREQLLAPSPIFSLIDPKKVEQFFDINPLPNSYSKFLFNFINARIFLEQQSAG